MNIKDYKAIAQIIKELSFESDELHGEVIIDRLPFIEELSRYLEKESFDKAKKLNPYNIVVEFNKRYFLKDCGV